MTINCSEPGSCCSEPAFETRLEVAKFQVKKLRYGVVKIIQALDEGITKNNTKI